MVRLGVANGQRAVAVVGEHHDEGVPVLFGKLLGHVEGLVKSQKLGDGALGVVVVCGPVHLAALNHQEKAVGIGGEQVECLLRHLGQRRSGLGVALHIVGHRMLAEKCPHRGLLALFHPFEIVKIETITILFQEIFVTFANIFSTTGNHNIHHIMDHLRSDDAVFAAIV